MQLHCWLAGRSFTHAEAAASTSQAAQHATATAADMRYCNVLLYAELSAVHIMKLSNFVREDPQDQKAKCKGLSLTSQLMQIGQGP